MSARSLSRLVVLALILLGVLTIGLRYQGRQARQNALADSRWRLTYKIGFEAEPELGDQEAMTLVRVRRPLPTAAVEVLQEDVSEADPSLKVAPWESQISGNREFRLTTRHAGKYEVTAEFDLRLYAEDFWPNRQALESLSPVRRRNFTEGSSDFPTQSSRVGDVIQRMPNNDSTESEKLQWIFNYCLNDLGTPEAGDKDEEDVDNVVWGLAFKRTSPLGRVRTFVTLCRAIDVPARLVVGFELRHNVKPQPHVWAEVHRANRWIPFDPNNGYAREMPREFVPVRRGGDKIVEVEDAKNVLERYTILRLPPEQQVLVAEAKHLGQVFDLTRLPLKFHDTLSLMLLLPLGALITAILRNLIGIRTLGTFAPALLAMSFIYAAWGTGIVILAVVVIVGLAGRTYLEKLHLLMVPRLSIVLTIIILCVVFVVSLLDYLMPGQSTQTVLIPLVILTILIERFFVVSEEDGTSFAVQLVLGTVVVAAFCYLLLRWDDVGDLVLIYPEIHFFTLAAFILIGRYSGYRLTELWRFRDLVKEEAVMSTATDTPTIPDASTKPDTPPSSDLTNK